MTTTDQRPDNLDNTLHRILQVTENNCKQLEAMAKVMERVTDVQLRLAQTMEANWNEFQEFRATTGAALARIDRIMDYLLKQDAIKKQDENKSQ